MDTRLLKAAQLGDVASLHALLQDDPLLLERVALAPAKETPLHIAALAGKPDFVHEIILQKPLFAWELNEDGFSPLHIASAVGNKEVVHELLKLGSHLCMLRDKEGLIPLHHAAMKGRVAVIEELLQCCPESLKERTTRTGQTVLHLAVKNYEFEALKTLVEKLDEVDFINADDKDGNTILQMAKASKQQKVLEYLEGHSLEIVSCDQPEEAADETPRTMPPKQSTKKDDGDMSRFASEVVASLIVTVTYQAGLSPPATLPTADTDVGKNCTFTKFLFSLKYKHCPETTTIFYWFMILNTLGFFSAVSLLVFRKLRIAWLLMPTALFSLTLNYVYLSIAMTPKTQRNPIYGMTLIPLTILMLSFLIFSLKRPYLAFRGRAMNKAGNEMDRRMAKQLPSSM